MRFIKLLWALMHKRGTDCEVCPRCRRLVDVKPGARQIECACGRVFYGSGF